MADGAQECAARPIRRRVGAGIGSHSEDAQNWLVHSLSGVWEDRERRGYNVYSAAPETKLNEPMVLICSLQADVTAALEDRPAQCDECKRFLALSRASQDTLKRGFNGYRAVALCIECAVKRAAKSRIKQEVG